MEKISYKDGETVEIVARKHGHHYEIGSVVTIKRISRYLKGMTDIIYTVDGAWVIGHDEIAKIAAKPGEDCIF